MAQTAPAATASTTDSWDQRIEFNSADFGPPEILPEELSYSEKIGGGCFGSVFRGECRGKEVAIKKLFRQDLSEKALNDFKKEVEICSRLHHPNVLLFMGACTVPGHMAIVMELMPQGNFEKLLHDPQRHLSLYRRLSMAKQTAQGMNWLHLSKPMIIHRDLKPSNLLVDQWGNIKVCDFGLSAVKPLGEKLKDKDSIPGTPLWMAPEVMMGRPLDEKSDVYSFGIVLWEIATQKTPFPEMTSFPVFKRAICIQNVRPPVPDDMLPSLRNLLELCWHKNPATRPSFGDVIRMLDIILVDAAIADESGRHLWKTNLLGKEKLTWAEFVVPFFAAIKQPIPDEDDIHLRCLKSVLAKQSNDDTMKDPPFMVDIEDFGRLLSFFGPMEPVESSILDTIYDVVCREWFFGDISKERAELILQKHSKGFYLVRLSTTVAGSFTISKVSKKGKINHQRVDYTPGKGFSIRTMKKDVPTITTNSSLAKLCSKLKSELFLIEPCPGSPFYNSLFAKPRTEELEGYLLEDED